MDPRHLLETFGALGLFAIVFAESGLFFGFFLPGDSLLVTAGLLASQDKLALPFPLIALGCFVAAVAGDQVGYAFGRGMGPPLFRRPDSRFFKREHLDRAQSFFDHHGVKTIVLARFVPDRAHVRADRRRRQRDALSHVRHLQRGRRPAVGRRRDDPRVHPGQEHPQRRQVPPADHRRRRPGLTGPHRHRSPARQESDPNDAASSSWPDASPLSAPKPCWPALCGPRPSASSPPSV